MRNYDVESLIEQAFIDQLALYVPSNVIIKSWDDIKYTALTPLIKIKAQNSDDLQGVNNYMCAFNIMVDFGVFTSKRIDENGRVANALRGKIRELLNQSNIVTLLNTTTGLTVYENGVIPQSSSNEDDEKVWQKNLTVLVVTNSI